MKRVFKIDKRNKNWREEWLEYRRKGIGGSDIGAVIGYSEYSSPLAVWANKVYGISLSDDNIIEKEVGLELENYLRRKFEKEFYKIEGVEIKIKEMKYVLQADEYEWAICNIDGYFYHPVDKKTYGVELKTVGGNVRWGVETLPVSYYAQCQWGMYVTGWGRWYLAYLAGNRYFEILQVDRNEDLIKMLVNQGKIFWEDFVLKNVEPCANELDGELINELHPVGVDKKVLSEVEAEEVEVMYNNLNDLKERRKAIENDIKKIENRLKQIVGDFEVAETERYVISYKNLHRNGYYVKESDYRMLKISEKKEVIKNE